MLTGPALGNAISEAIRLKGVSKAEVARNFGIKQPSVYAWINHGRVGKQHLNGLFAYFSDVVGPEHWGMSKTEGQGDRSQSPIPDPVRLGLALTAIDRVIRERGLVMEGRLGTFSGLLSFAYLLQEDPELFPNGFAGSTAAERKKYDAKVKKELGGLIRSGQVEVVGKDEAASGQGAAES